jgi:hypothetical protein
LCECAKGADDFLASECCSYADVSTHTKGKMAAWFGSMKINLVWVSKLLFISIGCAEANIQ